MIKSISVTIILIGLALIPGTAQQIVNQNHIQAEKPPDIQYHLSEILILKAENFKLRLQLNQTQCESSHTALMNEQVMLISDFRNALHASENQEFDWSILNFREVKK